MSSIWSRATIAPRAAFNIDNAGITKRDADRARIKQELAAFEAAGGEIEVLTTRVDQKAEFSLDWRADMRKNYVAPV